MKTPEALTIGGGFLQEIIYPLTEKAASVGMTPNDLIVTFIKDLTPDNDGPLNKWLESYQNDNLKLTTSFLVYLAKNRLIFQVATEVENFFFYQRVIDDVTPTIIKSKINEDSLKEAENRSPIVFKGLQAIHSEYLKERGDIPSLNFLDAIRSVGIYKLQLNKHFPR